MVRKFRLVFAFPIITFLSGCTTTYDYQGKAIILISGEIERPLNDQPVAIISYNHRDSVYLRKIELPAFRSPVIGGDSVYVRVNDNQVECDSLYSVRLRSKSYVYIQHTEEAFPYHSTAIFRNGVLVIGTEGRDRPLETMEFYTYPRNYFNNSLPVYALGASKDTAFMIEGRLGNDTLAVLGHGFQYLLLRK